MNVNQDLIANEIKTLNKFYKFLREHKNECVIEIMQDYCDLNDIPLEELGFLISEDAYLKDYVEANLIKFKFCKVSKKTVFSDDF